MFLAVWASLSARRAWIEIAVLELIPLTDPSLSARRAWIEILCCVGFCLGAKASLSARRAWIEILIYDVSLRQLEVALRKESVDRNNIEPAILTVSTSRSPQGERG